jgi:hypothetical protein
MMSSSVKLGGCQVGSRGCCGELSVACGCPCGAGCPSLDARQEGGRDFAADGERSLLWQEVTEVDERSLHWQEVVEVGEQSLHLQEVASSPFLRCWG